MELHRGHRKRLHCSAGGLKCPWGLKLAAPIEFEVLTQTAEGEERPFAEWSETEFSSNRVNGRRAMDEGLIEDCVVSRDRRTEDAQGVIDGRIRRGEDPTGFQEWSDARRKTTGVTMEVAEWKESSPLGSRLPRGAESS